MNPHDIGLLVMGIGAGIGFAQAWNALRRRRREAAWNRVHEAYMKSRRGLYLEVEPPVKPLNYFERELAEHTCSFGDRCDVRIRAKQIGVVR